jgi:uncharacterized protein (TIGR03437 family)
LKRALLLFLAYLSLASAQVPTPNALFAADAVHEIRLRFQQADWYDRLTANYLGSEVSSDYLTASFEWGSVKFASIGVRFKGNSAYYLSATPKKPFRLKLNEFVKGQKIEGMDSLNLSNAFSDPSFVREKVYYEMAAALGLKTPRSNFAALYINDEYWGLYVLGEVVNKDFLQTYFGSGAEDEGNLYKGNIGATFAYLGESPEPYKEVWEKQTNEEDDDWRDLIALCKLIRDSRPDTLRATLEPVMDVDSFLTAMALDNATVNLDNYTGVGQNFNIYRRPSDGRWVWIVWDPSLAFAAHRRLYTVQELNEIPIEWTLSSDRPLAIKLWAVPEYRERYYQIYKQLVENVFLEDEIVARMTALHEMVRPYVTADTQKLVTQDQFDQAMTFVPAPGPDGDAIPGLQPFVEARLAFLRVQLPAVQTSGGGLRTSTSALTFSLAAGNSAASQTVQVTSSASGPLPSYSIDASVASGGNWLRVSPTGSSVPGSFSVSVSTSDLSPGIYTAFIRVFSSEAVNSPILLPVSFLVTNSGETPGLPVISAIVNAASYSEGAIAPGEIVTLFGANLGPAQLTLGSFLDDVWSPAAGGVQVTFDGVAAPILYTSAGSTTVVAPFELAGKSQTDVRVFLGTQASDVKQMAVTTAAPGLFTVGATGSGQGAILNQSATVNSDSLPAPKGSIVSVFLTGAGETDAAGESGAIGSSDPLQRVIAPVTVTIGGQRATVLYSGAVPDSVQGLYQVNVEVPLSTPSGAVPIRLTVDGKPAQESVILVVQ